MRQFTLEQIQDKTALLPDVIATAVCAERGIINEPFVAYAVKKTEVCYNMNALFRRRLDSPAGRWNLESFMKHWLDAWLKGGRVRERMEEIFRYPEIVETA